jgi:DNA ligase (NAD+)
MTRDEAKERLLALGAKVARSVSTRTDYVVIGQNPGSKATRAAELGLRCWAEGEFLSCIQNGTA